MNDQYSVKEKYRIEILNRKDAVLLSQLLDTVIYLVLAATQ